MAVLLPFLVFLRLAAVEGVAVPRREHTTQVVLADQVGVLTILHRQEQDKPDRVAMEDQHQTQEMQPVVEVHFLWVETP
jgi:hypothetical protein